MQGTKTRTWLNKSQAQRTTLKGRRDRAILAVMTGCGLRREEVAQLEFESVQQRDGRCYIVDIRGKHDRIRAATALSQPRNDGKPAPHVDVQEAGSRHCGQAMTSQFNPSAVN